MNAVLQKLVAESPSPSDLYYASPDIVDIGGNLIAKFVEHGSAAHVDGDGRLDRSHFYESSDGGSTWQFISTHDGFYFGLFIVELCNSERLVLFGNRASNREMVLIQSTNGGVTWDSYEIFPDISRYEMVAEIPYLIHDDVIYVAGCGSDIPYPRSTVFLMYANINDDLSVADNWTKSADYERVLADYPSWGPDWGVAEANVVANQISGMPEVWVRINSMPDYTNEQNAVMVLNWDGESLSLSRYQAFDGGYTKFQIRQDAVTGSYFCARNSCTVNDKSDRRTLLVLDRSEDLVSWRRIAILASTEPENYEDVGYQYPSFRFSGDDIVAVIRSAQPGVAANYHDSNAILFARVPNFRSL
jgi:hypothetical protein